MSTIPAIPVRRSQRISTNDLTPSKITSSLNQSTPGRTTARRNLQHRLQSQLQAVVSNRNESEMGMHNVPVRRVVTTHHQDPLPSDVSISDLLEETPSRFFAPPSANNSILNNDALDRSTTPTKRPSNRRKSSVSSNANSARKKKTTITDPNADTRSLTFSSSSSSSTINSSSNLIIKILWKSLEILSKVIVFILTPIARILFSSGKGFGKLMFYATPRSKKIRTNIIARWKLVVTFFLILFSSYFIFQFKKRGSDLSTVISLQHQLLNLDKKIRDSQESFNLHVQSLTDDVMRINQQNSEYAIALDKLKNDQTREIGSLEKNQNLISDSINSIDSRTKKYSLQYDRMTLTINEIMEKIMEISKNRVQGQQQPPPSLSGKDDNDNEIDHYQKRQQRTKQEEELEQQIQRDYFETNYNRIRTELLREIDGLYFDKEKVLELLNNLRSAISMINTESSLKLPSSSSSASQPLLGLGTIGGDGGGSSSSSIGSGSSSMLMVNYANSALGARIIKKLTSKTFEGGSNGFSSNIFNKFGLSYLSKLFTLDGLNCYGPAVTLNNRLDLGNCWPLKGSQGQIAVQLRDPILVTHFSIGHSREGPDQLSAPNDIEFYAFVKPNINDNTNNEKDANRKEENKEEEKLVFIAKKNYDIQSLLDIQTFEIDKPIKSNKFIFKINSNHGNGNYTCIYRIGLHSQIQSK